MRSLTGLRAVAAIWVMVCHCWYLFGMPAFEVAGFQFHKLFALGWAGVIIFFVLSGFLLSQPFVAWKKESAPKPKIKDYLIRRIFRVFPAYYAQLIVLFFLTWMFQGVFIIDSWYILIKHLLFIFNIGFDPVAPIIGTWWTLPVEFTFYLSLPIIAYLMGRRTKVYLLAATCLVISMAYHFLAWQWLHERSIGEWSSLVNQAPGYLYAFAIGIVVTWFWTDFRSLCSRHHFLADSCALLGIVMTSCLIFIMPATENGDDFWSNLGLYYFWRPALAVAVASIIFSCCDSKSLFSKILGNAPLVYLGEISYSIYLWHLPIISTLKTLWPNWQSLWLWVVAFCATILISHISNKTVERPFIAAGKKLAPN